MFFVQMGYCCCYGAADVTVDVGRAERIGRNTC